MKKIAFIGILIVFNISVFSADLVGGIIISIKSGTGSVMVEIKVEEVYTCSSTPLGNNTYELKKNEFSSDDLHNIVVSTLLTAYTTGKKIIIYGDQAWCADKKFTTVKVYD